MRFLLGAITGIMGIRFVRWRADPGSAVARSSGHGAELQQISGVMSNTMELLRYTEQSSNNGNALRVV